MRIVNKHSDLEQRILNIGSTTLQKPVEEKKKLLLVCSCSVRHLSCLLNHTFCFKNECSIDKNTNKYSSVSYSSLRAIERVIIFKAYDSCHRLQLFYRFWAEESGSDPIYVYYSEYVVATVCGLLTSAQPFPTPRSSSVSTIWLFLTSEQMQLFVQNYTIVKTRNNAAQIIRKRASAELFYKQRSALRILSHM